MVGTGFIKEDEPEPSRGRLLLLQLTGPPGGPQELKALFEQTVNGCVYSVAPIRACPGKFVATVNSQVSVFAADPGAPRGDCLRLLCKTAGMILALYADVAGHTIVVGDLMRSVAVYAYNPDKQELTLVAKDFDSAALPLRWYHCRQAWPNLLTLSHHCFNYLPYPCATTFFAKQFSSGVSAGICCDLSAQMAHPSRPERTLASLHGPKL